MWRGAEAVEIEQVSDSHAACSHIRVQPMPFGRGVLLVRDVNSGSIEVRVVFILTHA
jgi:hypothetical protein